MKSCLFSIGITVLLLCFTGSVSAEELDSSSLKQVEAVHVEAGEVVMKWESQYKVSVRVKSKTKIKISSKCLKHAMINKAVAGDLVATLKKGGKIKRKHLKGCRDISSELSGGVKYFVKGNYQLVEKILVKVDGLIELQPQPSNLTFVLRQFNQIQKQVQTVEKFKGSTKKLMNKIDKKGSKRTTVTGTTGTGTTVTNGTGTTGSNVNVKVKSKVKVKVKTGSKGTTGSGTTGSGTTGSGTTGGTTGSTNPCINDSASCLGTLGIDSTVTNREKINWSLINVTTITTTINVTTINWTTRISVNGTINWGGITCTGDPGIACYTCMNGKLSTNDSLPCDDGKSCTTNDHCSAGVCVGTQALSPVAPCN